MSDDLTAGYLLPRPSVEEIDRAVAEFAHENGSDEWLLTELFCKYPTNDSFQHVLLKTKVLNLLYGTRVLAINLVAEHITRLGIDADLNVGTLDAVDRIARVRIGKKERNNFSFASKYCSWHRPDFYPIYDTYVEESLWQYKTKDGFTDYKRSHDYRYPEFKTRIDKFRDHYGLNSVSYKQLDAFLYRVGEHMKTTPMA
jgi:hypothetical protein